ncbi:hypothetical protein SISNIDRAFT_481050 [Sistotremastrum niveocremeum HHB9708]|uniref:Uncharacterized protein n=1 Tax=Sistotremastrum niveocremeum HHB9708 TaxID=1314777 RepID=A0A164ZZV3_9AGAM|nr:hypothetical protein SISNIDRAFT_481050 [Sistotremastrum niveocremeum HHB9708]
MSQVQTTKQNVWIVSRYSRSYPEVTDGAWQHYQYDTPPIRVLLEQTETENTALPSIRLRILWQIQDGQGNQNEIVFEDIDLLEYSKRSFPNLNTASRSLPIRALYKDNTVGLKYLNLALPSNATPDFRRIQIIFSDAQAALSFIAAIGPVCPCQSAMQTKAVASTPAGFNPPPPSSTQYSQIDSSPAISPTTKTKPKPKKDRPPAKRTKTSHGTESQVVSSPHISRNGTNTPRKLIQPSPSVEIRQPQESSQTQRPVINSGQSLSLLNELITPSSVVIPILKPSNVSELVSTNLFDGSIPTVQTPPVSSQPQASQKTAVPQVPARLSIETPMQIEQASNFSQIIQELPPSSASTHAVAAPLTHIGSSVATPPTSGPLIQTLSQLYKLPTDELESLVSTIVQEPGFTDFLQKVDTLWKVRGFVGL